MGSPKPNIFSILVILFLVGSNIPIWSETFTSDSLTSEMKVMKPSRTVSHISLEYRPEFVLQTNSFLKGDNSTGKSLNFSNSEHFRYVFSPAPKTLPFLIYSGVYQGFGLSHFNINHSHDLGNPTAVYLFQGARLAKLSEQLSINYEWNFGLSFGWNPFDEKTNPKNNVIGSAINAYMNLNLYLNWDISPYLSMCAGTSASHFSNGNTDFPNRGLNLSGFRVGLLYHLQPIISSKVLKGIENKHIEVFPRHVSYDLIAFGAWRRKGVYYSSEEGVASPEKYIVSGFNFSPMYNFGYTFRAGVSLDGVYDESANVYLDPTEIQAYKLHGSIPSDFLKPSLDYQMALGLSARAELVMPYFRVNIGFGRNLIGKGDQRGTYQVLALKIALTKGSFLHIGYNLKDFHEPNFLMLGIGYRFHDKYPSLKGK